MCVAALAWEAHGRWRLAVAANRDEYHERPSAELARWESHPDVLAGRDLRSGGTWIGVSEEGRFVLVTNFRVPGFPMPDRPSRGGLVSGLLTGTSDARSVPVAPYNPFNLLFADTSGLLFLGNYPGERRETLASGVHGVSNGDFELTWPKASQLANDLHHWLSGDATEPEHLFEALRREGPLPADAPPIHAPGSQPEPRFAPVFIRDPVYGTRSSTVVLIDRNGAGTIIERRFAPSGECAGESTFTFRWPADT